MMASNVNVPEIRFKGFVDAWTQRKFSDIIKLVGGATPFKQNADYWGGSIVWLSSQEIKDKYVTSGTYTITQKAVDDNTTKVVKSGTPLIVTRSGILAKRFPISIPTVDVAINQDIKALIYDEHEVGTDFLVAQLQKCEEYILKSIIKGGTTVQSVNVPDLQKFELAFPAHLEQIAVGNFFHTLDDIITASQRKVAGLKQLKAAYLQQMFPQAGERVPRVRFSEFTGDWNEVKVGEIAETYSGGTPSVGIKSYYNGAIPFIRSAEINSDKTELYLSNDGLKNSSAKMVNVGTILYALYGATSGEVGRSKIAGAINQAILAIEPKDNYNFEFIAQWLRRQKESIVSTYLQGGQGNLSAAIIKELHISAPLLAEQTAIGNFFCNLDTQIAAKSEKLEKLKQIKAAYLQKMFI